jgi:hypothetical protein
VWWGCHFIVVFRIYLLLPKHEEIFSWPDIGLIKTSTVAIFERQIGQLCCHFLLLCCCDVRLEQPLQAFMMQ